MGTTDTSPDDAGTVEQELRTLSFRMREIQRLLNLRVEQENRRLEAAGLEPVPERTFASEASRESSEAE